MLVTVLGTGNSTTTLTLLGLGQVPTFPTTCPKNLMFLAKNIHLLGLNFKLTSHKCFTICIWLTWVSHETLWLLRSSTKTLKNCCNHSKKKIVIVLEKILVTFLSPIGIIRHSYRPILVMNVVFFTSLKLILICQNPFYKSKIMNHFATPIWLNTSSISGNGYTSLWV
jgi:hypothetical protein